MNELPPELKAMQGAMDLVFGAINAVPRQMDTEEAILRAAPFDYLVASEIFAALQRRLELRYEDRLNEKIEEAMVKLSKAFESEVGSY